MKKKEMKQGMKQGMKMRLRIIIGLGVLSLAFGSCLPKEEGVTEKSKPATISSGSQGTSSTILRRGQVNETGNSIIITRSGEAINSTNSIKTESTTTIQIVEKSSSPTARTTNINQFAGGTGSRWDPYQIATVGHLDLVRWNLKKHFIVIKDLDLGGIANFEPIGGYKGDKFEGIFDGKGKKIQNLKINRPREEDIGLFGAIGPKATVKNVKLEDVNLKGKNSVGGLVGKNNGGTIDNSYSTGTVTGNDQVGGLVGSGPGKSSSIKNSYSTAKVKGNDQVGGLMGSNLRSYEGTIANSYATGNVEGNVQVGGLVGAMTYNLSSRTGKIENSHATGNVTGTGDYVGGLTGSGGIIQNNYATGNVTGTGDYVGGLVGAGGAIQNNYATGNVEGNDKVGGLLGRNFGTVQNNYATGNVTGNDRVGGLVGENNYYYSEAKIENSYATGKVTGKTNVGGFVGINGNDLGIIAGRNYWKSGSAVRVGKGVGGSGKVVKATDEDFRALNARSTGWSTLIWNFQAGQYPKLAWQD